MQWIATYTDGSTLSQYNEDGSENAYKDIDRERLHSFALLTAEGRTVLVLMLDPGQRLIYRKRHRIVMGVSHHVIWLVGWQQTIAGQNVQSIAYVGETGSIILGGKFKDNDPWMRQVELFPFESE